VSRRNFRHHSQSLGTGNVDARNVYYADTYYAPFSPARRGGNRFPVSSPRGVRREVNVETHAVLPSFPHEADDGRRAGWQAILLTCEGPARPFVPSIGRPFFGKAHTALNTLLSSQLALDYRRTYPSITFPRFRITHVLLHVGRFAHALIAIRDISPRHTLSVGRSFVRSRARRANRNTHARREPGLTRGATSPSVLYE
jgi:hypothetical protein